MTHYYYKDLRLGGVLLIHHVMLGMVLMMRAYDADPLMVQVLMLLLLVEVLFDGCSRRNWGQSRCHGHRMLMDLMVMLHHDRQVSSTLVVLTFGRVLTAAVQVASVRLHVIT